jgi:hypothetical protein
MNAEDVSYHYEHPDVGGKKFARCDICKREVVPANPDSILHEEDCKYEPRHERGGSQ